MLIIIVAMHGNTPVKNGWRMNNIVKDKWYIIYAKSVQEKEEWMAAFQRERERVKEDEDKSMFLFSPEVEMISYINRIPCFLENEESCCFFVCKYIRGEEESEDFS